MRATVKAQKQELEQLHLTCEILQKESVIETIKRRKIGIFNGIKDMFEGRSCREISKFNPYSTK